MLTETGVRLLDFGLAKQHEAGAPGTLTSAPTRTALTMEGSILGTLHYMSPEQLDGKPADARSDVFSFGATLYEMVSGRRPFDADSQASVIGAILKDAPAPLREIEPGIPRRLDRVVRTCLAKDPEDRWQTMRDLKRELQWIDPTGEADEPDPEPGAAAPAAPAGRAVGTGWRFALALLVTAAVTAAAAWTLKPAADAPPLPVQRFTIDLAPGQTLTGALAVSPDGRHVVYGVEDDGGTRLHARALDTFDATPIPGTEGAAAPVAIAPDGRSLVFQLREGEGWTLNQIPLAGGTPYTIAEGEGQLYAKAVWLPDGTVVYSMLPGGGGSGLMQVPAAGGAPRVLTRLDDERGDYAHLWPLPVPGRDELIFTIVREDGGRVNLEDGKVAVYSPASGDVRVVLEPALGLGYLEAGYLLYGDRGSLLAIGVDPETPATTGAPVPLFFDTSGDTVTGNTMSDNGTLAYTLAPAAAAAGRRAAGADLRGRQLVRGAEAVALAGLTPCLRRRAGDPETSGAPWSGLAPSWDLVVWLMWNAFAVSCNQRGVRAVAIFVAAVIAGEVASKLLLVRRLGGLAAAAYRREADPNGGAEMRSRRHTTCPAVLLTVVVAGFAACGDGRQPDSADDSCDAPCGRTRTRRGSRSTRGCR